MNEVEEDLIGWDELDMDMGLCDLFNPATRDEALDDHSDHGSEDDDFWTAYTLQELDKKLMEQEMQSRKNRQTTNLDDK